MYGWEWNVENEGYLENTLNRCREKKIVLPTFEQLRDPSKIPAHVLEELPNVDLQEVHPLNLFRINWRNSPCTGGIGEINHVEIPKEITGVNARIIGLVGKFFPTGAHKVGATYGCLAPYLINGKFDPSYHKAVWPSTGNYCRGGAFNSALLGVDAVAILPEEMSKERFDWLKEIGAEVHATYGCESNVKEIYDKCHELEAEGDQYLIFNQFDQFGNPVWHYNVTGPTINDLFNQLKVGNQKLSGYVSATGSAGTIGAGDYLRTINPLIKVVASEALQCPTLLQNGYGAHRIEGIGDKHIPWVHNVKNTDAVSAIDDEDTLKLLRVFNEDAGHRFLESLGVKSEKIDQLPLLGISSLCNLVSSIKLAKYFEFNDDDVIFTIFTDSKDMYNSRLDEMNQDLGNYDLQTAAVDWNTACKSQGIDNFKELSYYDKKAVHNLKYFTWVEQQGKNVEELNAQWDSEEYWAERFNVTPLWDKQINQFNDSL